MNVKIINVKACVPLLSAFLAHTFFLPYPDVSVYLYKVKVFVHT